MYFLVWDLANYYFFLFSFQKMITVQNPKLSKQQKEEMRSQLGHTMSWKRYHRYAGEKSILLIQLWTSFIKSSYPNEMCSYERIIGYFSSVRSNVRFLVGWLKFLSAYKTLPRFLFSEMSALYYCLRNSSFSLKST